MKGLVVAATCVVAVAACATNGPGSGATRHDPGGPVPRCPAVWVVGKRLPDPYTGCLDPPSEQSQRYIGATLCLDGRTLLTLGDHLWGYAGGLVMKSQRVVAKDLTFRLARQHCLGLPTP